MEKHIKLKMDANKTIHISVNGAVKHIISVDSRNISADKIYEILDFSIEDEFSVSSENIENLDENVLKFFYELFEDIANKIKKLSSDDGNFNLENDEDAAFSDDIPF